jgi:hypothetical protein
LLVFEKDFGENVEDAPLEMDSRTEKPEETLRKIYLLSWM